MFCHDEVWQARKSLAVQCQIDTHFDAIADQRVRRIGHILAQFGRQRPLLQPTLGIGWILVFSLSIRELSMSVLLAQTDTQVMSTIILQFIEDGAIELAAALSVVIVGVSLAVLAVVWKLSGRTDEGVN